MANDVFVYRVHVGMFDSHHTEWYWSKDRLGQRELSDRVFALHEAMAIADDELSTERDRVLDVTGDGSLIDDVDRAVQATELGVENRLRELSDRLIEVCVNGLSEPDIHPLLPTAEARFFGSNVVAYGVSPEYQIDGISFVPPSFVGGATVRWIRAFEPHKMPSWMKPLRESSDDDLAFARAVAVEVGVGDDLDRVLEIIGELPKTRSCIEVETHVRWSSHEREGVTIYVLGSVEAPDLPGCLGIRAEVMGAVHGAMSDLGRRHIFVEVSQWVSCDEGEEDVD